MSHTEQRRTVASRNPATGAVIAHYPIDDAAAIETLLARSQSGFESWRRTPIAERAQMLARLSERLLADIERLAALITTDL